MGLKLWREEVQKEVTEATNYELFTPYCNALTNALQRFEVVTNHLLGIAGQGDAEVFMADATLYMEFFGILNVAWQWLRMGQVAQKALLTQNVSEDDRVFYESKIQTMQFFYKYELSKIHYLADCLLNTEVLTVVGEREIII